MGFNKTRKLRLIGITGIMILMMLGIGGYSYLSDTSTTSVQNIDIYNGLTESLEIGAAKIVLTAPTEVRIGKLVVLDVSKSAGKTFKWLVTPETEDFLVIDGGRRAVFSSGVPGEYMFIIACAINDSVDVRRHIVRVINTAPSPTPGPPMPIDPVDPVVNPISSFSKLVAQWCSSIQSPTKAADAIKLAQAFESVAAQVDAGTLTQPYEIITATTEAARGALGPQVSAWIPFLRSLQTNLEQQASNGTLSTAGQHAQIWKEIAQGLRHYATS